MKEKDVRNWEYHEGCFGSNTYINDDLITNYDDEELTELLLDVFKHNQNGHLILLTCIEETLKHLQYELIEDKDLGTCDQCGTHGFYYKYTQPE
jgi:hypothetical protein